MLDLAARNFTNIVFHHDKKQDALRILDKMKDYRAKTDEPWLKLNDAIRMKVVVEDHGMVNKILQWMGTSFKGRIIQMKQKL